MSVRRMGVSFGATAVAALLIFGCSVTQPAAQQTEAEAMKQLQDYWDRHSGYREESIREGAFKTLRIGQSPAEAVDALKALQVGRIVPLQDRRYATTAAELEQLRDATALRMGPGDCTFVFGGDEVTARLVAYDLPGHEALRAARTRDEVFQLLAKIVRPDPRGMYTVMTDDPDPNEILTIGAVVASGFSSPATADSILAGCLAQASSSWGLVDDCQRLTDTDDANAAMLAD